MKVDPGILLKRLLLAFWALWWTLVFSSNLCDGCRAVGLLAADWPFASGNYRAVVESTARYGTPGWVNALLFAGVTCWEGVAALSFWIACRRFRGRAASKKSVHAAFTVGLALWAMFLLADEIFIAYALTTVHLLLFSEQLLTLVAFEVLPEDSGTGG